MKKPRKFYKSELTVSCESSSKSKSYLGILLSIVVLLLISSMIVAAIVIINPDITNFASKHHGPREAISLEEAILGELSPKEFNFHWLPAGTKPNSIQNNNNNDDDDPEEADTVDQFLFEDNKNLNIVTLPSTNKRRSIINSLSFNSTSHHHLQPSRAYAHLKNNHQKFQPNITTLISNASLLSSIDYQGFKLSPSRRYLLIWTAKKKQFRHSSTAKYFLYDIKSDLISLLSTARQTKAFSTGENDKLSQHNHYEQLDSASLYLDQQQFDINNEEHARFQVVEWFISNLDSKQPSDSLILVQNNDIFVLNNVAELSSSSTTDQNSVGNRIPTRLTFTGRPHDIFNGVPDWLYEEEILGDAPAFHVSPRANQLAYMSFNDSFISTMPYTLYGEQLIPRIQRIKYPKAGKPNPRIKLIIIENFANNGMEHSIELRLPENLGEQQHYINRINWLSEDKLGIIWTNRNQNESFIVVCSRKSNWNCEKNLHLKANGGWLDMSDDLYALDDDYYLALILKDEGSDVGSFKHIAKVSLSQPNNFAFITGGRREVTAINGVDNKRSLVYYTSTLINEPGQRHLFVAELETAVSQHQQLGDENNSFGEPGSSVCVTCDHHPNGECLYNFAKMSPSTNYYIFQCDGPGVPRTELRATLRRGHRANKLPAMSTTADMEHGKLTPSTASSSKLPQSSPLAKIDSTNNEQAITTDSKLSSLLSSNIKNPIGTSSTRSTHLDSNEQQQTRHSMVEGVQPAPSEGPNIGEGDDAESKIGQESLLWTIEDNKELRDKLEQTKAMPLTMRLKVPIANTNYSANVLLLLPPQLGPTTTLRAATSSLSQSFSSASSPFHRPRRGASANGILSSGTTSNSIEQPTSLHAHFTPNSIKDYISQLTSGQQYPMVVDVYGGPGSQKVDYRFSVYFGHYLASSRRTVYAMIDGRGSGYQGTKRLYELYHKFGTVEIQDQIEVAAYLTQNLSFIDSTRVAIWGWSYGGYAAAMALAQSNAKALRALQAQVKSLKSPHSNSTASAAALSLALIRDSRLRPLMASSPPPPPPLHGVFECAASVAPVTNWIYYDTAYTEKYMSSPYTNELYDETETGDHFGKSIDQQQQPSPFLLQNEQQQQQSITANKWVPLNQTSSTYTRSPMIDSMMRTSAATVQLIKQGAPLDLNERYRRASLMEQIGNIDRKRFLLIHGTADDNVHFQQSIMLMKRLIQKNVLFESRLYPDQDHSIANKADKLHLGSTLSNFFAECFDMAY